MVRPFEHKRSASIAVSGLNKAFGTFSAISDVSLFVEQGETRCIIGPNGSGKSTLLGLIGGDVDPSSGAIQIDGHDVTASPKWIRARLGLARSYQTPRLFEELTVFENLRVAVQASRGIASPFRGRRDAAVERAVWLVLDDLGLAELAETPVKELPHGIRSWIEIGTIVAREPVAILLDEPVAGVDADRVAAFVELLDTRLSRTTIVLVEHDLDFVKRVADQITVLDGGRSVVTGTSAEVSASARVRDVYLAGDRRE